MKKDIYDIGIIGGGIAALAAASLALEAGYETILFEEKVLGGKAFNGGDLYLNKFVQSSRNKGNCQIDDLHDLFNQAEAMKRQYLKILFPFLTNNDNFTFINQRAQIIDEHTIKADEETYNCKYIILATGNKLNQVPIVGLDEAAANKIVLPATELRKISKTARKIAVLGGGRIAYELGVLLADYGVNTHIITRGESLTHLDLEIKEEFLKNIKSKFLKIDNHATIHKIDGNKIYYNDTSDTYDNIIMAFGFIFDESQFKHLGLDTNENGVIVNNFMQTSIKNIYAIGDVNMNSKFSNIAVKEAVVAINHIKGIRSFFKNQFINRFLGRIEYAYIGLTEEELIKKGVCYQKLIIREDEILENYNQIKFVKLLIDEVTREMLGIFVISHDAASIMNSILLLLEESIDDMINARLSFFTNAYFVTQMIKKFYKELDSKVINQYYQPFYQIKVDKNKKIVGAESLARFKNGDQFISPVNLIKNFEANGLIVYLDLKVFVEGLKLLKELESKNLLDPDFILSVNISSLTIEMLEYEKINHILKKYGVEKENVVFEITERKTYEDEGTYVQKLNKFKSMGYNLSMDDFSVGNSSLSLYEEVCFDEIKIDMALLPKDETDKLKHAIYKELVCILRKKNNIIVSEGVETETQYNYLKDLGVDFFQGYYFSKPLSKDDFIDLLIKS